jgi:hypothetical protein
MNAVNQNREMSLEELGAILGGERKLDYAVPANKIETAMVVDPEHGNVTGINLGITMPDGHDMVMPMTDYASDQFHSRLAKGFKTYSDHLREQKMTETYRRNIIDLTTRDDRTFRVRSMDGGAYDRQTARAVVSDKFKPIDDDIIFGTTWPLIDTGRFREIGGNKTDIRTVAKYIEREPSISIQSGDRRRDIFFGFIQGNSEVGASSAYFHLFTCDGFCTNGAIYAKFELASISYRHIGSRIDIRHGLIESSRIEQAELMSIKKLIADATANAMCMKGKEKIIAAYQEASTRHVTRDHGDFFKDLGKQVGLTTKEVEELPLHAYSDEFNQLGVQAAITALAQHKPYERRLELEAIGGNVLLMPERNWNALAVA